MKSQKAVKRGRRGRGRRNKVREKDDTKKSKSRREE